MSSKADESARKAAEQLWEIKYGLKGDWIEKATPIIAAYQTVAPPVQVIEVKPPNAPDRWKVFIGNRFIAEFDYEHEAEAIAVNLRMALTGAAPAVSTPCLSKKRHCHYHAEHFQACANCADAQAEYDAGRAAATWCPTELNAEVEALCDKWSNGKPDGIWGNDEAILFNLRTFARAVLAAQFFHPAPSPPRLDLLEQIYATLQNSKAVAFSDFDAKGTDFKLGELMGKMSRMAVASPQGESK